MIQQDFQLGIHSFKHVSRSQLPNRLYLSQKPLSRFDKLPAPGIQGAEKTCLFTWEVVSCIRSKNHERGNEFRIDSVVFSLLHSLIPLPWLRIG